MNDQEQIHSCFSCYDCSKKDRIECGNNKLRAKRIAQYRELYGIECRLDELSTVCRTEYSIDERIQELQTKKDNLIKGVE